MAHTETDTVMWADALMQSRRTVLPKRLVGPGPDAHQQGLMLRAAAAAPDHGQRLPWRLVEVPASERSRLGDAFAQALLERDPHANARELAQAREKALRAPWLLLAVCRTRGDDPEVPPAERLISLGCATQNLLLMASAMGFGSAITSGKALSSAALRQFFSLHEQEDAQCFINVGTVSEARSGPPRPDIGRFFQVLGTPTT